MLVAVAIIIATLGALFTFGTGAKALENLEARQLGAFIVQVAFSVALTAAGVILAYSAGAA
ncbi:hypothetical protein CN213_15950 [Sinorhizobium meliloti]|uniref:hypothetical protein n=1 Tax=Rhizobium meliloti TaxID=382 RepID=UPI000FD7D513|nr:hypothetical protein [Sinorhizobium meliloti]RVH56239.1 hypothetical protein CN213_15950 [Sinorhizobium meliloti]